MTKKTTKLDFESAIQELELIVEQMESGNITLEESLSQFERGIALTRNCQEALKAAEQKVEILMRKSGQEKFAPFDSTNSPE